MEQQQFMCRCLRCRWVKVSENGHEDFKDLVPMNNCPTCGGPRKYKCPQCGRMVRALPLNQRPGFTGSSS
jgi:hypothetical protein